MQPALDRKTKNCRQKARSGSGDGREKSHSSIEDERSAFEDLSSIPGLEDNAMGSSSSSGDADADEYDIFESSMESLFGQHQAASGKPGQNCRLDLGDGVVLKYKIPSHQDSSNTRLFAHYQWDAGLHLALMLHKKGNLQGGFIANGLDEVQGKHVLELGAGTGLPSLACALGGASQVVITDYPDEGIIKTMKENIDLCNAGGNVRAFGLDWTDSSQVAYILQESPQSEGYDLILCADTLWLSDFHAPLLETICRLLKRSSSSRVVLLSGFHTGRRVLTTFYRRALEVGLCSDWPLDNESVFEYNAVTRTSRPWSSIIPFPAIDQVSNTQSDEQLDDNMDDYTERTKWLLYVALRWADLRQV
jgi:nicotinamide N-methyltransferase